MNVQEMKKREREEMSPIRYKMNRLILPIFCVVFVGLCVAIALVGAFANNGWWCLLPAGVAVLMLMTIVAVSIAIERKELKIELGRWAYLFKTDLEYDGETLETEDPETEIKYLLSRKGIRCTLPFQGEQVFDEAVENEFFLPWSDVEIVVATDNFARRVRIAAAVIDVSKRSVVGSYLPTEKDIHFLPMEEELVAFFDKLGLTQKISVEWRYIQREPNDAFRQILTRGYIRWLKDEHGKRIKRENADHLYRD